MLSYEEESPTTMLDHVAFVSEPNIRFGHTAIVHKSLMYIFGGWDGTENVSMILINFVLILRHGHESLPPATHQALELSMKQSYLEELCMSLEDLMVKRGMMCIGFCLMKKKEDTIFKIMN